MEQEKLKNNSVAYNYLVLGAGNFSGPIALLDKHYKLGKTLPKMTWTDIVSHEEAWDARNENRLRFANLNKIKYFPQRYKAEVKVLFSVDATKLQDCSQLEAHYQRIQFDMPQNLAKFDSGLLQKMISDFFASASQLQKINDKIYMAIPQPLKAEEQISFKSAFYYQCYYNLYEASTAAGYHLYCKRNFVSKVKNHLEYRYPGYIHMKTADQSAQIEAADNIREFVFIKTNQTPEELRKAHPYQTTKIWQEVCKHYPAIETDTESDDEDFDYLSNPPDMDQQSQLDGCDENNIPSNSVQIKDLKRMRLSWTNSSG